MDSIRLARWLVLGSLLLIATTASAGEADDANRAAARALGNEGVAAYDAGDYATAVDKLGRAYRAFEVPTLGLWLARSLARVGRLVEASERYQEVMRLEVTEGVAATQQEAQAQAEAELAALQPRIPTLTVRIEGEVDDEVEATIDGVRIPMALLGVPRQVNPGERTVVAKRGRFEVTEEVTLSEGEQRSVVLRFEAAAQPETRGAATSSTRTGAPSDHASTHATQRRVGWVVLGVGAAGLLTSGVTGAMAMAKRSAISDNCDGNECGEAVFDDVDRYNTLRGISTVGFVIGSVGVATGGVLLLTIPKEHPPAADARRPVEAAAWIGPTSLGVVGRF